MSYRQAGGDDGDMSKDTLFTPKPHKTERSGIFQSCEWFKESWYTRWQFGVMLLFALLTPIWLILKVLGSSLTAEILSGISGIILACYGANHFRILLGLKEQVDRFAASNSQFKEENGNLHKAVDKLEKAQIELKDVQDSLKETTKAYQDNIATFKNLDEKLSKFSENNIEGIEKIQKMSKMVQNSIQKELIQHQRDILHTVSEAMEFRDDQNGLTEDEYNKFISALPKSFQIRFQNMNKSFNDLSGGDGLINLDEFTQLADEFAVQVAKSKTGY